MGFILKQLFTSLFGAMFSAVGDGIKSYRRDGALKSLGYTQASLDKQKELIRVRARASEIDSAPFDADIDDVIDSL